MSKKLYMVTSVEKDRPVLVMGMSKTIRFDWADGMAGICPIFSNKKSANAYKKLIGNNKPLLEFEAVK